jgi:O-acetylhomoserine/O-acetylserine sulfhydrylase-like pyridoxal-dependent enzyme
MKSETIAIHGGYDCDPTTKAVAVPIHQTVAFAFDSADHGALRGAIVEGGNFPWRKHADRFPTFSTPDASYHGLVYVDRFGPAAYVARCRSVHQRTTGSVLSPMSAFLLLQMTAAI